MTTGTSSKFTMTPKTAGTDGVFSTNKAVSQVARSFLNERAGSTTEGPFGQVFRSTSPNHPS